MMFVAGSMIERAVFFARTHTRPRRGHVDAIERRQVPR
jgi:hypothetical protein